MSPELSGEEPPSSQFVSQSQVGTGVEDELSESDEEELLPETDEELPEPEEDETLADTESEVEAEVLADEMDALEEDELMVSMPIRC